MSISNLTISVFDTKTRSLSNVDDRDLKDMLASLEWEALGYNHRFERNKIVKVRREIEAVKAEISKRTLNKKLPDTLRQL